MDRVALAEIDDPIEALQILKIDDRGDDPRELAFLVLDAAGQNDPRAIFGPGHQRLADEQSLRGSVSLGDEVRAVGDAQVGRRDAS